MAKPLTVTSSRHPVALACYFIQGLVGFGFILDITTAPVLTDLIGVPFARLWALFFLVSGVVAFLAAIIAPKRYNPTYSMAVEGISCLILCACTTLYAVGLFTAVYPDLAGALLLTFAFVLGDLGRGLQTGYELRRLHAALKVNHQAAPAGLAEVGHDD